MDFAINKFVINLVNNIKILAFNYVFSASVIMSGAALHVKDVNLNCF